MIYITVICNRLKSPIDLTWDRKQGWALVNCTKRGDNTINLVTWCKINMRVCPIMPLLCPCAFSMFSQTWSVGRLVVFYVPSTARSYRDGTPFAVPCEGCEATFLHLSHPESNPGRLLQREIMYIKIYICYKILKYDIDQKYLVLSWLYNIIV